MQARKRNRWLRLAPWIAIGIYAILQAFAMSHVEFGNDSYRYARHALEILGESRAQASATALHHFCLSEADKEAQQSVLRAWDAAEPPPALSVLVDRCERQYANGLPPTAPQYEQIFDTRPGYPLMAAPFIAMLGVSTGMWVLGLLLTAASSLLVWLLVRLVGLSPGFALVGQVAFLVSPLARYGMDPMTEGAVTFFVLITMTGAWVLGNRRGVTHWFWGVSCVAIGFTGLGLVKYSTAMVVAAAFAVMALLWLLLRRPHRANRVGTAVVAVMSFAALAAAWAITRALALPGLDATLQDSFTYHFHRPPVADPWPLLVDLEVNYWREWFAEQAAVPLLLVLLPLALVAAWRLSPRWAVMAAAAGGVGIVLALVHPFASQGERLWVLVWVPVVLGVPAMLDWARGTRGTQEAIPAVELHRASATQ